MVLNLAFGMKRLPQIDVVLMEDGVERAAKRGGFEVEVEPQARKTESLVDVFNWPSQMLQALEHSDPQGASSLKRLLLETGLEVKTFYSGQDCAGQALSLLRRTLARKTTSSLARMQNPVEMVSASDIDSESFGRVQVGKIKACLRRCV